MEVFHGEILTATRLPAAFQASQYHLKRQQRMDLRLETKRKRSKTSPDKEAPQEARKEYDYLKDVQAPSWDLGFGSGPHTLVEILTFLSRAHLSFPIANRLMNNGLDYAVHQFIVRRARSGDDIPIDANSVLDGDQQAYPTNTILKGYQITMREGPIPTHKLPRWKFSTHTKPLNWNGCDLNLDGFLPRCTTHLSTNQEGPTAKSTKGPEDIAREDLLKGVRTIPSSVDALDLTRAVPYAQVHPNKYRYPQDLPIVVNLLGGPAQITADHYDVAAIARAKSRRDKYKVTKKGADKVIQQAKKAKRDPEAQVAPVQQQMAAQPAKPQFHLLRDYGYPVVKDKSDFARCVRYAKMVDQMDYFNNPDTIASVIEHLKTHDQYRNL